MINLKQTFSPLAGWIIALSSSFINILILLHYQFKTGGDFPFQDEWGYVERLTHLHQVGFLHYLFDHYQVYYIPGLFFIWYIFFKFFHLSIMAIRYTGVATSAIASLVICILVLRQKKQFRFFELVLLGAIPFVFCSLNHFATYNQSIESIIEPLLFFFIILACWAGQKMMGEELNSKWPWVGAIVLFAYFGLSMYAPALSILIAIAIARGLLLKKIDMPTLVLGFLGFASGLVYSFLGKGTVGIGLLKVSLTKIISEWIMLFGNSIIAIGDHKTLIHLGNSEEFNAHQIFAFTGGAIIIVILILSMVQTIFAPAKEGVRYFVPFALALYTFGVSLEIALKFNDPNFGEVPRYAIHMLGGPIAILVWGILVSQRLQKIMTLGILYIFFGTIFIFFSVEANLPYFRFSFETIRTELKNIRGPITASQQKKIFVNPPLMDFVYPDLQFMRANRLALFDKDSKK